MSKNTYSVFESVDQKTGRWETVGLYTYKSEGIYDLAQLINGHRDYLSALFGEEPFDIPINDDGDVIDNLVDPLEQIDEIIKEAISCAIPPNTDAQTQEYYAKFALSGFTTDNKQKYFPPCVTYTLRDLNMLEMLAKGTSPAALRFYNRYFAQIRWLLHTIMRMKYISGGSDVRVIIWGY